MQRRALIQAGALLTASTVAGTVQASEKAAPAAAVLNLPGMGLPIITDGRVRNYVFIVL